MIRSADQLRQDCLAIWQAGLAAVRSDALVRDAVRYDAPTLWVQDEPIDLGKVERIVVVGAGKAGAGMAAGLEAALGDELLREKDVQGWVNVPDDCVRPLRAIHLHPARPAGVNEPTEAGVLGAAKIVELVESLGPRDLCICLISGGGSALMPLPVEGVSLADKLAVTRFLSGAGANIEELNAVRSNLSRIKGGGLARAARHGRIVSLIISDVLGDPLHVIASGPSVDHRASVDEAVAVLEKYGGHGDGVAERIVHRLKTTNMQSPPICAHVTNHIIGNNAMAVDAAGIEAERRGYSHAMQAARSPEGPAEEVGRHLARMARAMRDQKGPDCLITGGEPTVTLPPEGERGKGGRNQQLVLAALDELRGDARGIALLSGGTDGEDGPTDAAGAFVDADVARSIEASGQTLQDYLRRCDAYTLFAAHDALIRTGPTHTNVCDLRVVVVERVEHPRGA